MAVTQMIGTACDIGLPDALPKDGLRAVDVLANELSVNSHALLRSARALTTFGIFTVDAKGQSSHNARSNMLRTDYHPSQHWAARFWISTGMWRAWGNFRHSLRTGEDAFKHAHDRQFFDYTVGNLTKRIPVDHYSLGAVRPLSEMTSGSIDRKYLCQTVIFTRAAAP